MNNQFEDNDFFDAEYESFSKVDPLIQKERAKKYFEDWVQKRYGKKMIDPLKYNEIEPMEIMVFSNYPGVLRKK